MGFVAVEIVPNILLLLELELGILKSLVGLFVPTYPKFDEN